MFSKIRNRLTVLYTVVMASFLLAFITVSYAGVLWLLHREEQQDIIALAEEEAREHVVMLKQNEVTPKGKDNDNVDSPGGKMFYYVFDTQGNLVAADQPVSQMRANVQDIINKWNVPDGEGKIKRFISSEGDRVILIMSSAEIRDGQQLLGRVYVGEDITSYYQMLKTLLIVLLAVSLLFVIAAAFIGHLLAGRAMIPIKQSFLRQREFAADASHELRTPLSIFLTSVDAVQADDDNHLSPFSTQVLVDMKSEVRRMTKIVSDLLTLARADAGVSNIVKENFDLSLESEQLIRVFRTVAAEKGLTLEIDSPQGMIVFADKERINQLLLILVDNAIKYTPAGGRIDVLLRSIAESPKGVSIIVKDTGVGISEESRNLIFERFYRADKARTREEGGTGLGLSIAKWIVEAHGGIIKVESVLGRGSSFIVKLPS